MIDLHCHSTFSDGAHCPTELLNKAVQSGVRLLALTDHDTMAGLPLLHQAAKQSVHPIKIINGIELSTRWKKHELHIIGLNIPLDNADFNQLIARQRESRQSRALEIAAKLLPFGIENAYEKACAIAGHDHVARPHFARLLMDEGYTKDMQSGFNRYLGRGKPAYVPTSWVSVEDAAKSIASAGGKAVIAHPFKYSLSRTKLKALIETFKDAGGAGIEVISGEMLDTQISELVKLCKQYELKASSGSDFHSDQSSRTGVGRQRPLPLNCTPIWNEWIF